LKTKEGDKVAVPKYSSITSLIPWQTALAQAVVNTSGNRSYKVVMQWISEVWAPDATFAALADSGGDNFVTLDIKLTTAMSHVVSHDGQDAK
jgi:hypothetical protein